jgi:hypothetical protein
MNITEDAGESELYETRNYICPICSNHH